ncbi:UNVERIFIED_CONTAM: hypothetical protein Slati_4553200 [Sesamum latifolium]|uniref:Uncharacterized protein n=1 Tax=Sesamum latifolium TaxID=2727402 RepID=A0AAW2S3K1_9LAMI
MCPENAMRSPLSDLAQRERVFSSDFLSHSKNEESGLCPSYRYPWETKRATEGKGCSLSLGLWRGEGREENVLRASFFASCTLTSKMALRPRRHSGRKGRPLHKTPSVQERCKLPFFDPPSRQGRERKWTADGGRGRFESLFRRSELFYRVAFSLVAPPFPSYWSDSRRTIRVIFYPFYNAHRRSASFQINSSLQSLRSTPSVKKSNTS